MTMKIAATHSYRAVPSMLTVAPSGSTKLAVRLDTPERFSTHSMLSGRVAAELAEEAAFTEPAENAYRLLLHMERDPDKLADWVGALTRNHPESEMAKEVARTFGPGDQGARALSALLSDLLEKEVIARATKESQLKSFKEELLADGEAGDFLLEALIGRMRGRGLVDEEEAKQLLENLRGEKE